MTNKNPQSNKKSKRKLITIIEKEKSSDFIYTLLITFTGYLISAIISGTIINTLYGLKEVSFFDTMRYGWIFPSIVLILILSYNISEEKTIETKKQIEIEETK